MKAGLKDQAELSIIRDLKVVSIFAGAARIAQLTA
jgi:hypothetical protein